MTNSPLLSPKQIEEKLKTIHSVLPEDKLIVKHLALEMMADGKLFTEENLQQLINQFLGQQSN